MKKMILITGATDGIGLLTAQKLADQGHKLILHGRNRAKLDAAINSLNAPAQGYLADLSDLDATDALAADVLADHNRIDVLINNAGVLKAPVTQLENGQDIRFVVNTLAPALLTHRLLPAIPADGRVINLSSAAQAPVQIAALTGEIQLGDMAAYAQSKLALTIWSQQMAQKHPQGPSFVAVNPGSLLATNMVRDGFGMVGNDLNIGADILFDAATGDQFASVSGQYFDNDSGSFAPPHPAASDLEQVDSVMATLQDMLKL